MASIHAGPWCGAVEDIRATLKASISKNQTERPLLFSTEAAMTNARTVRPTTTKVPNFRGQPQYTRRIATYRLEGLTPNTHYFYLLKGKKEEDHRCGEFKTFPRRGERVGFRFGLGSCSQWNLGSRPWVYEHIAKQEIVDAAEEDKLRLFCHMGDIHYGNIRDKHEKERVVWYDDSLRESGMMALFSKTPVAYVWDDHDFLGNNSRGGDEHARPFAKLARSAYDRYVPHYLLPPQRPGIFQAFTLGNVLFLLTDTRYNRTVKGPDGPTILGKDQKKWFKQLLLGEGKLRDLIVWVNSVPWIGKREESGRRADRWSGFHEERHELATFIKDEKVTNLCMISGDAHMLAIDDGNHSGYADGGKGGFPVFQAASLNSPASKKGGPYTHGPITGRAQYGLCTISYKNDQAEVLWEGKRVVQGQAKAEVKMSHRFPASKTFSGF